MCRQVALGMMNTLTLGILGSEHISSLLWLLTVFLTALLKLCFSSFPDTLYALHLKLREAVKVGGKIRRLGCIMWMLMAIFTVMTRYTWRRVTYIYWYWLSTMVYAQTFCAASFRKFKENNVTFYLRKFCQSPMIMIMEDPVRLQRWTESAFYQLKV